MYHVRRDQVFYRSADNKCHFLSFYRNATLEQYETCPPLLTGAEDGVSRVRNGRDKTRRRGNILDSGLWSTPTCPVPCQVRGLPVGSVGRDFGMWGSN